MSIDKQKIGLLYEAMLQGTANDVISEASNLGSNNPYKGPTARSLFYEAAKRTPGKYGQFLFYSLGSGGNDFIDAYYRSESSDYNTRVSSIQSKNPTAGFLVRETATFEAVADGNTGILSGLLGSIEGSIIGGLSAPYYWKDFLYCKHYGTIPNNYMITLRRFPTPVLDNLSVPGEKNSIKSSESYHAGGAGRPVAQAVTWFGGNTGNVLSELIAFSTGINWKQSDQGATLVQEAFSKGFFQDGPIKFFGGVLQKMSEGMGNTFDAGAALAEGVIVATDKDETISKGIRAKGLRDLSKERAGIMGEYIWTPVDVVTEGFTRNTGLSFTWGGLNLIFEYELSSIGEVNSKAAFLDLMGNLLSIGTNYGNFLTPDIRYNSNFPAMGFPGGDEGLQEYYKDPLGWLITYGSKLSNLTSGGDSAETPETIGSGGGGENDESSIAKIKEIYTRLGKNAGNNIADTLKEITNALGDDASRFLKTAMTGEFIEKYQAPLSFLTGAPIGEWHVVIGNPCNPIAMIGNLLCDDVSIEFGDTLGPDDFPTTMKATFKLKHARSRERGEIESIFNRGDGRLYHSSQKTSANLQSFGAFADVAGNVLSEDTPNQGLSTGLWNSALDNLPDSLGPGGN
jgi:hypothetical protein